MDVRCDLCQTEYELDDDSVSDAGASVQCTTCGHTFVVGRNGARIADLPATPPSGVAAGPAGPPPADWLLATEDGQTHRFRDLTTLQKWIVERKVTPDDRIAQKGGPWRRLGEVSELGAFFEVVGQADRARSAQSARPPSREPNAHAAGTTPTRQTMISRQTAARMGGGSGSAGGGGGAGGGTSGSLRSSSLRYDSSRSAALLDSDGSVAEEDEGIDTSIINNHRNVKIAGAVGVVALAAVAAFIGFKRPHWLFGRPAEPAPVTELPPAWRPAPAPPPVAVAPQPAAPSPPAAAPPAAAPPAPPAAAQTSSPTIEQMPSRAALPERPAAEAQVTTKGKSYERLVAEADHLLENGQHGKAQKLIDEALVLQPNGVAALTGSAYLLLDREKQLAAISTFKRALGSAPEFPPALFGLGEAYRAEGDLAQAAESYRKYLSVAPGGPDAPAARRQLKDLESAAARRAPAAPAAAPPPESAKLEERPVPAPDQPAP
jgi:predicted Zn finger-like uncharacterized protein